MKIKLCEIPLQNVVKYSKHREECQGYIDKGEDGVYGMEGRLNIRPEYQREFIYKDKQRDAVIHSIQNNFPLNVLYWVENKDGSYEVLDGQQRLISIGQYVSGDFSIENMFFHNRNYITYKRISKVKRKKVYELSRDTLGGLKGYLVRFLKNNDKRKVFLFTSYHGGTMATVSLVVELPALSVTTTLTV